MEFYPPKYLAKCSVIRRCKEVTWIKKKIKKREKFPILWMYNKDRQHQSENAINKYFQFTE